MKNEIKGAYLPADKKTKLPVKQREEVAIVSVPDGDPDTIDAVVVLEIEAK